MLGPNDIALHETTEEPAEFLRIFLRGDDETPGLLVETGGGPARGLPEAAQRLRCHSSLRERARTPSPP